MILDMRKGKEMAEQYRAEFKMESVPRIERTVEAVFDQPLFGNVESMIRCTGGANAGHLRRDYRLQ